MLNAYFPPDLPGSDVTQGVTVLSRVRPDYDFEGTQVGDVVIRPQLAEGFGYDDNLLGHRNGSGSALMKTEASIDAVTDWSRNSLGFFIGTEDRHYLDLPKQNENDWRASLGGSFEIGRDTATLTYKHLSQHQDPGDVDSANFDHPLAYQVEDARASYRIVFSRFSLEPSVELVSYRFSPGLLGSIPLTSKNRDRNEVEEQLTARYEVTPQQVLVGVVRPVQVQYTASVNGFREPSSTGVAGLAGLDYLGLGALRFRALVGYETRSYANTFKSHSGPIVEADGNWTPTGLTTFTGSVSRRIEDAGEEDSVGYTYTLAKLSVDHELQRNVLLNAYAGIEDIQYLEIKRTEMRYHTGVGATWLLNRYARLIATYDFTDSNRSGKSLETLFGSSLPQTTAPNFTRDTYLIRLQIGRFDPLAP